MSIYLNANLAWQLCGIFCNALTYMYVRRQDFFQGETNCGDLLERFWFSSAGVGVYVADDVPLHTSFNDDDSAGLFVLKADYDGSEYRNLDGVLPVLR